MTKCSSNLFTIGSLLLTAVSCARLHDSPYAPIVAGPAIPPTTPLAKLAADRVPIYGYVDEWSGTPQHLASEFLRMADAGVSTILMAFHLVDNAGFPHNMADTLSIYQQLSAAERSDLVSQLHARGTSLLMSSGGESEGAAWMTHDPVKYATDACHLAMSLGVDGVDWDKEGFGWMSKTILSWLDAATTTCREVFPGAIMTSAPQSPFFTSAPGTDGTQWGDGLFNNAGQDKYLIQYYNQGWGNPVNYDELLNSVEKGGLKPLWERYEGYADKSQFVIGKPYTMADANGGSYIDHTTLREWTCRLWNEEGFRGGLMFWKIRFDVDYSDIAMLAAPCDLAGEGDTTTVAPTTGATTKATTTATTSRSTTTGVTTGTTSGTTTAVTTSATTTATTSRPITTAVTTSATTTATTSRPITTAVTTSSTITATTSIATTSRPTTTATTSRAVTTTPVTSSSTTPRHTTTEEDIIGRCRSWLKGAPHYEHFSEQCRDFCQEYGPGGELAAYCPAPVDALALAQCVVSQQSWCVLRPQDD